MLDLDDDDSGFAELRAKLEQCGQAHIFEEFDVETDEELALAFIRQLLKLDRTTPGGLVDYCVRGRRILSQQQAVNANDLLPPQLGDVLVSNSPQFEECEELGWQTLAHTGFVLVAGGLGERLGFAKTKLETDLLTHRNMLHFHLDVVLAVQHRARQQQQSASLAYHTPFCIMTSESNHSLVLDTVASYPQADELEITVLKQSEVPCFRDCEGRLEVRDFMRIVTKPHGHGDVHSLLFQSGLPFKYSVGSCTHLVFFQDTNVVGFHSVLAALGNSVRRELDVNFVCVERSNAHEPMGLLCTNSKTLRTSSVEYNLLDKTREYGPHFPGNINLLVARLDPYCHALRNTRGLMCPEFINPKYKQGSKEFSSPARLECLMQDFVLAYPLTSRVGFTQMERFLTYSPMKNNAKDAMLKYQETGFPASPASAESDFYHTNRELLAMCGGVHIKTRHLPKRRFLNLPFEDGARVALLPSFALSLAELRARFPTPHLVRISDRSSLVIEGDVVVYELDLDGDLRLVATGKEGSRLIVTSLCVHNAGSELEPLVGKDSYYSANERIRGYSVKLRESLEIASRNGSEVIVDRPRN